MPQAAVHAKAVMAPTQTIQMQQTHNPMQQNPMNGQQQGTGYI